MEILQDQGISTDKSSALAQAQLVPILSQVLAVELVPDEEDSVVDLLPVVDLLEVPAQLLATNVEAQTILLGIARLRL